MLAEAQKKLSKTSFVKADITNENALSGKKFNLITAFRFFLNAEPSLRAKVIKSLVPHLEDDGYLIFNNHHCLNSPWIKLYNWRHLKKDPTGFYKVMTIGEMNELVDSVGLKIVKIYPVGYFRPPKIRIPDFVNSAIEKIAFHIPLFDHLSESPIAVCKKK